MRGFVHRLCRAVWEDLKALRKPTPATSIKPMPTAQPTVATDWQPLTEHGRYLKMRLALDQQHDEMMTKMLQQQQDEEFERMRRSLRMNVSHIWLGMMYDEGRILKSDWEKYWLSTDAFWVPPILDVPASFVLHPVTTSFVPILNYTTKVGVTNTVTQLTAILAKSGCREVSTRFESGKPIGLVFLLEYQQRILRFRLPTNPTGVLAKLRQAKIADRYKTPEHAERVAWRIVKDWVEAQLAVIESGQVELVEVFLPYALDEKGRTLFQNLQEKNLPQLGA